MKKAFKVFLVLSIVLMALGLCLCVGALATVGFDLAKFSMNAGELSEFDADIEGNGISDLVLDNVSEKECTYRVTLVPSPDGDFHVAYGAYNEKDLRWEVENGTIRFYSAQKDWRDYINIISFGVDAIPLTIEVPASVKNIICDVDAADLACEDLSLEGDFYCNSDAAIVKLQDVNVAGSLSLDSDAADIRLERIKTGSLNVDCDFGKVEMTDLAVGNIVIDADTCDIDLTSIFSEGVFDLSADYGMITMEIVSALTVQVETDSCDVDFASLSAEEKIIFKVSYGDINGTIDDAQSAYTIFMRGDSDDSNILSGGNGPKVLDVTMDSGDVDIQFLKTNALVEAM